MCNPVESSFEMSPGLFHDTKQGQGSFGGLLTVFRASAVVGAICASTAFLTHTRRRTHGRAPWDAWRCIQQYSQMYPLRFSNKALTVMLMQIVLEELLL